MAKTIEVKELYEMFYQAYKDKYPDIDPAHLKTICRSEFIMLKRVMQEGDLESVRLKYLFKAEVSVSKVMYILRGAKRGKYTQKTLDKMMPRLISHINRNVNKYKNYESEIREITGKGIRELIDNGCQ